MEIIKCLPKTLQQAFLIVALIVGGAGVLFAEERSPTQKGQELSEKLCARCHSVTRDGDSPFAEAPPFRTFSSKWPLESLEEALAEGIVVGHPAMPEFVLGPEDIQNLLSYIASISN